MIAGASAALRSSVMLFLFRAYTFQCTLTPASRQSRSVSPRPGVSTFTTSAPKSASCRLSMLPATSREKSSTRTPSSGPARSGSNGCLGKTINRARGGLRAHHHRGGRGTTVVSLPDLTDDFQVVRTRQQEVGPRERAGRNHDIDRPSGLGADRELGYRSAPRQQPVEHGPPSEQGQVVASRRR